jgi:hypothetical protein
VAVCTTASAPERGQSKRALSAFETTNHRVRLYNLEGLWSDPLPSTRHAGLLPMLNDRKT